MHHEKMNSILEDVENKEVEIAGGSVVCMVLSCVNSLIKYICNLTIGKKSYIEVEGKVKEILEQAEILKQELLKSIDQDKDCLKEILSKYKTRKENPEEYINVNKKATEFCMQITLNALETLKLTEQISKIGNQMLSSDFKICAYYAFASVEASIVNVEINLEPIEDKQYKEKVKGKYLKIYEEARKIKEGM